MQPEDLNLPAAALAAATPGQWPVPLLCAPADMLAPRDWCIPDPTGTWTMCRITGAAARTVDEARANAFVVSAARDTLQLALDTAGASYATSSAELIDRARGLLRALDDRFRGALAVPGRDLEAAPQPAHAALSNAPAVHAAPPRGAHPDTLVLYVDAHRHVRQHRCSQGEGEAFTAQLPRDGLRSFMFTSEHPFGIDAVFEMAPELMAGVRRAVSALERDAAAMDAMDRHDVPADPLLRAKILRLVAELKGSA